MGPIAFHLRIRLMRNYPIDLLHIDTGLPSRREAFGKQLCAALSCTPPKS
jgi:hypothetical protein